MTTYLTRLMIAIKEVGISKYWIGYFREKFRGEVNDQLLEAFRASGITKADIARKLDRRPEQITRWLSAPCNLEADTISDLALAFGHMPKIVFVAVGAAQSNNRVHKIMQLKEESFEASSADQTFLIKPVNNTSDNSSKTTSTVYDDKPRMGKSSDAIQINRMQENA